ncbi:hypothetical protein DENSPDRAFT_400305 [Dentipellis sp. KUC8613]|nr:hypothetical protein DENSPDRAFT_400305 [Dentipellis sp. KUC8613]
MQIRTDALDGCRPGPAVVMASQSATYCCCADPGFGLVPVPCTCTHAQILTTYSAWGLWLAASWSARCPVRLALACPLQTLLTFAVDPGYMTSRGAYAGGLRSDSARRLLLRAPDSSLGWGGRASGSAARAWLVGWLQLLVLFCTRPSSVAASYRCSLEETEGFWRGGIRVSIASHPPAHHASSSFTTTTRATHPPTATATATPTTTPPGHD